MYKMIGADGRHYGPVTAEQLRQWIAENRVNANTQIQVEGSPDWKPLGSFPEFADALAAKAFPPPSGGPAPFTSPPPQVDPEALAASILSSDYSLDIGSCFSRSWELVKANFWLIVGATFVVGLINGTIPLLGGVCLGGLYYLLLKLIRGERAGFGDAFAGFSLAFLQLFLAGLVSSLLTSLGILLCILPGIYLAVAWMLALPLVIDKRLGFWDAMEVSRKVISLHWWAFLGLALMGFLVLLLGFLVCCVGVYVAQPVLFGAIAYAYEDIFGRRAAG